MKYDVTYACGHTGTVQILGPEKERARKLDYLTRCSCPECQKVEKNAALSEYENAAGLPELTGTEKQINWARKLRQEQLTGVEEFMARFKTDEQTAAFIKWLKGQTEAKFWIENRDKTPQKIAWLWKNETTERTVP